MSDLFHKDVPFEFIDKVMCTINNTPQHRYQILTKRAERMAEYQALEEKIVMEDAAWVPLFENMHLFALGERVAEFVPYWAGYSNFYAKDIVLN